MNTIELLDRLVAFPTISATSNLDLLAFVRDYLAERGVASTLIPDTTGQKANLFASVGPTDRPGICCLRIAMSFPSKGRTGPAILSRCASGTASCSGAALRT